MSGDEKKDEPEFSGSDKSLKQLHPAYSVTNVQSKIRTLDGVTVTYTSWVKLFRFHVVAYQVTDHIDGTEPPPETATEYKAWKELDALVLQWILSTVSDDLLPRVLDTGPTARHAWVKLEKLYLSNKKARAGALETRFCNLTLSTCSSLDDYCQRLKDLANQLEDVDHPITEDRLVLQLVRGLPAEYDTTASLINANSADWDLARSMLEDERIRQEARQKTNQSVHVATTPNHSSHSQPQPHPNHHPQSGSFNPPSQQPYYHRTGRGRGRGRSNRGRGSGRGPTSSSQPWPSSHPTYPQWAWWNTPPCPYPTQPAFQPTTPYNLPTTQTQSAHYSPAPQPNPTQPTAAYSPPTYP
ncbi:uncharacterized protein LOC118485919 [Helianthus annuus]|uniref:uncharacterized protein LOC118485919 n=1 Tax=Helianthus annuus TaxID=4232 RepID=UPI001652DFF7|nr:uncharacterized protein LOC118485919 [Helianthus annuus]